MLVSGLLVLLCLLLGFLYHQLFGDQKVYSGLAYAQIDEASSWRYDLPSHKVVAFYFFGILRECRPSSSALSATVTNDQAAAIEDHGPFCLVRVVVKKARFDPPRVTKLTVVDRSVQSTQTRLERKSNDLTEQ